MLSSKITFEGDAAVASLKMAVEDYDVLAGKDYLRRHISRAVLRSNMITPKIMKAELFRAAKDSFRRAISPAGVEV